MVKPADQDPVFFIHTMNESLFFFKILSQVIDHYGSDLKHESRNFLQGSKPN